MTCGAPPLFRQISFHAGTGYRVIPRELATMQRKMLHTSAALEFVISLGATANNGCCNAAKKSPVRDLGMAFLLRRHILL
jgi:hypothetical protein